ncbi:helix-turn-helix domain-containing protein [Rhizomonospora bruguierae]|uniref:helix-turn-helix domain-containing protein n=1 Tax=Rhizomonospora bruguierae TaxID=1581705 RepID=UPI001BCDB0B3|nr:helix-turn-helix domain-containing protein [Micromonospora sp. NBRC 107566]
MSDPHGGPEPALIDRLTSMQALLALSMAMAEGGDEQRILHLATSAVPTLGRCRMHGVYSGTGWWTATGTPVDTGALDPVDGPGADLEAELAALDEAGGPVMVPGEGWGWAYPLRSLDGQFGFLVAGADRQPPAFDQFLLRVLAQQTGIALANTRLHARERAAAVELRVANEALVATVAAFERRTAIHDRLTRVAVAGEGQQGIADAVHELTGCPVAVEDRYGAVRAWAGPGRPEPYPRQALPVREALLRRIERQGRPDRDGDRLMAVAHPRPDVLGVLVIFDPDRRAGEQEQAALEHGATVLAMELARLHSQVETELRLGRDLAEDLLAGADPQRLLSTAQILGYDLSGPHRVVVTDCPEPGRRTETLLHAVRRAARDHGLGSLLVPRGRAVVVISRDERPWEGFRRSVEQQLAGRCRVGIGGRCDGPTEFPRSHREAQLALRMQDTSGGGDRVTVFDELGVYQLLAEVQEMTSVERYVREWLGALLDYDASKQAELVRTLSRYLEHGGNYEATAKALAVHRSTLKYRLRRIREISGHDVADPETHFSLQLATRAQQTLLALRHQQ